MDEAIHRCLSLLMAVGDKAPRYRDVFGSIGPHRNTPDSNTMNILLDVLKGTYTSPAGLDQALRGAIRWIAYANSLKWDPLQLTEWNVAAFVREQQNRGKTAPDQARRALI